ncbi:cellulase family glycosylhydrolase [Alteromonadaceae bacterium BrNp21-10]|nr:cellulase family glycosylhydrolase [Alteromonadaceae bacterium BrNp21-10]
MLKFFRGLMLMLGCIVITACGSSSGGGSSPPKDPPPSTTLSVSPTSIEVDSTNNTQDFSISTNTNWSASTTATWLTLSATTGNGSSDITITATTNNTDQARSTDIVISAGALTATIQANQDATDDSFSYDIAPDATDMRELASTEFTALMGVGFNIGNSLEAVGGETAWGNPMISEALIDAIKAAGFKSIRLPVAWSQFSDETNFVIKNEWMDRVEQVVSYAISQDLIVMMNIHWDGGWMQPTAGEKDYVNHRLDIMWRQIAIRFRDYDDRLLFAGTNEVMVEGDYGTPTEEYYSAQNSFNQTFVTTVRKTGGRNAYRQLIVQGFNTNIDHTINYAVVPTDVINNRLMMEVHFYDPYNFTLNANSNLTQWGANATDGSKAESWANEAYIDSQFLAMRSHFHDQGVGLILGEYGAISRTEDPDHEAYRLDWNRYVTKAAVDMNMVPFYWDNGDSGNHGFALFNRATAAQIAPDLIQAIVAADSE